MSSGAVSKTLYSLKDEQDRWELEEILHDSFYSTDLIRFHAEDNSLKIICTHISHYVKWKWKFRVIPYPTITTRIRKVFVASFKTIISFHVYDNAGIHSGDISTIACRGGNLYRISGVMPTYIDIFLDAPFCVSVVTRINPGITGGNTGNTGDYQGQAPFKDRIMRTR